jgi:hypothetical protein
MTDMEAVKARYPDAYDCYWPAAGWHGIFTKPITDPDRECLHSDETQDGDGYPFMSAEEAWADARAFIEAKPEQEERP